MRTETLGKLENTVPQSAFIFFKAGYLVGMKHNTIIAVKKLYRNQNDIIYVIHSLKNSKFQLPLQLQLQVQMSCVNQNSWLNELNHIK